MQLVDDAPIPNPESVSVAALQLFQVVVRGVRVCRNLFDLRHDPPLPVRRELGNGVIEQPRRDDVVHGTNCYSWKQLYARGRSRQGQGSVVPELATRTGIALLPVCVANSASSPTRIDAFSSTGRWIAPRAAYANGARHVSEITDTPAGSVPHLAIPQLTEKDRNSPPNPRTAASLGAIMMSG